MNAFIGRRGILKMYKEQRNFFKWQILSRLPEGSIYERVKEGMKWKELSKDNPFYYIYWLDLNRSNIKKYVLGTYGTSNADYHSFISWLDKNYGNRDFYCIKTSFGVIQIPKPSFQDYKCFKAEFLDIIMPYLVSKNDKLPFLEGPYEFQDVMLTGGDIVLDLGANYGLFSSVALAKGCEVYAFEPTTSVRESYLKKIAEENSNMKVFEEAVSNKVGQSMFELNTVNSCNKLQSNPTKKLVVPVMTTTVDEFVSEQKISHVDFIKADIEGAERLMLEGAKRTIQEFAPKLSICYYHKIDDLKVLRRMIEEANPNYDIHVQYRKIYAKDRRK
ncbi:MAG: FkbM family methyltransferase [Bacilli bacterium]|nr:FkbM family methyltransferase [Bacilli bacterium]